MNKIETLIRQYLAKVQVMQLATVKDGQPWCCNVHYAFDDELNLYWVSTPARRHSQEIASNAKVAAAIMLKPDNPVIGVQIEGVAIQLADRAELEKAVRVYDDRYHHDPEFFDDYVAGKREHKVYRLTPRSIVLFSEVDFPGDPRQEWNPRA